ncbi:MAG: UDP-N-acetylmuramoyl-L-alanine--D-glutamate ligase [Paludibacteraceae bacterium]|nr:UDP-N-acetylmuramoyl-L-alanine--D-glutamate ligase [Paludibacteraceae bacterium]
MKAKLLVVLGAGESGVGSAILAKKKGYDVFVSDMSTIKDQYRKILEENGIDYEEKQHTESKILSATEVVKSPGIPNDAPMIKKLEEKRIPVISEIEFAGRYTNAKMICITGSNGKTTTTSLIYYILKNAGLNVGLAGNIGKSLALQVANENFDYYVIELSSFQLDNMYEFKADVAILMNITPDHLDRYDHCMQNYVDSKMRIVQNQTENDVFIYWTGDPIVAKEIEKRNIKSKLCPFGLTNERNEKAFVKGDNLVLENLNLEMALNNLALKGTHNLYNSMAAGLAAAEIKIEKEVIRRSLATFQGVEHRLEPVAKVRNIMFINDSKATNVNSCWYALESMTTPTVLILGGKDKGNDYTEIEELVKNKVKALVFLGVDNTKLHAFFDGKVENIADASSMKEAVQKSYQFASQGDTVLLSPCCASFDLFKSYEDRGKQFKDEVRSL